jgi:hypothetical protein
MIGPQSEPLEKGFKMPFVPVQIPPLLLPFFHDSDKQSGSFALPHTEV